MPKNHKLYLKLHFNSKKIKDYDENDFKDLYDFLFGLINLIGVIDPPEKEIMISLITHLKSHHSDFSKEEIEKAFSLGMANKLEMEFKIYNRLTPQFMSDVLCSYKRHRSKAMCEYNRITEKDKYTKEKPTQKEIRKKSIEICLKQFSLYNKDKKTNDWGNICYDFLCEHNLIKLGKEEKQLIYQKAKIFHVNRKKQIDSIDLRSVNGTIKSISKQMALHQYFDKIIENETTLLQIFKNKIKNEINS